MITCDDVYTERNQLVAALSKLFPSYLVVDLSQKIGWRTVVYVELPTGQASWHIPDHEINTYFDHLKYDMDAWWDGHTTEEKYERLAQLEKVW